MIRNKQSDEKYLAFFHHSEECSKELAPWDSKRPVFYWFSDRIFHHFAMDIENYLPYFYLFVKNPRRDNIEVRARSSDIGFNGLYRNYFMYRWGSDGRKCAEPGILLSFSRIKPNLIVKFDSKTSNSCTIIKPDSHAGRKINLYKNNPPHSDKRRSPIPFVSIPEIVEIAPNIKDSYPIIEPEKRDGKYIYNDWVPMITEQMGVWL